MSYNRQPAEIKSPYLFFIRFIALFAVLQFLFPFYRGVTGPGGRLYSPMLAEHFNLIKGMAEFLTRSAQLFLNSLGFQTYHHHYNSLRIGTSRGVVVNPSCLGWGVISFWIAFIYANAGAWQHKFKWMAGGIVSITLLNIVRIALIVLANHLNWSLVTRLDHHQTFNIASYTCIFILIYWYIIAQKKYERTNAGSITAAHRQLTTIQ